MQRFYVRGMCWGQDTVGGIRCPHLLSAGANSSNAGFSKAIGICFVATDVSALVNAVDDPPSSVRVWRVRRFAINGSLCFELLA